MVGLADTGRHWPDWVSLHKREELFSIFGPRSLWDGDHHDGELRKQLEGAEDGFAKELVAGPRPQTAP